MKNDNRKFARALTIGAGLLCLSGLAGAQTVVKPRVAEPVLMVERPVNFPRPEIVRPVGGENAWPVAVAAAAVAVQAATVVAHHVTERWQPGIGLPGRGQLTTLGGYDR